MNQKSENWKTFFKGAVIDRCAKEVRVRNYENLRAFSLIGIITMCFAVLFGQLMREVITFNTEFLIMLGYFVLMYVVTRCTKKYTRHSTGIFYLWMVPLMAMGILMGTFSDPTQPSITIMVFLCVLPLFILDKPWRIITFIAVSAAAYTACCYIAKTKEMFVADMIDLVLFFALGVGVNCLILKDRIYNVEHAVSLKAASETDALTKILNRGAGEAKIQMLIDQGIGGMFCILDVDEFKSINDQYGHTGGDEILKTVAKQLQTFLRENDIVMRMGGDEFAIYVRGIVSADAGKGFLDRLFNSIEKITFPKMQHFQIAISLGGTFFHPAMEKNFETLYHESDDALYQAKRNGKHQYILKEK